jgi:hypothetical protein
MTREQVVKGEQFMSAIRTATGSLDTLNRRWPRAPSVALPFAAGS